MTHIPDHELLMEADGELDGARLDEVRRHLAACSACRTRQTEFTQTLRMVVDRHWQPELPPDPGAGARLRAEMRPARTRRAWAAAALAAAVVLLALHWAPERAREPRPRAAITPGAVRPVTLAAVCADGAESPAVAPAVALRVFRSYGIYDPRPRTYEVDFLIPPDLGGSNDPRNLWPQPYDGGVWNARVKDALEDRLRTMVCSGGLDLAAAQREFADDWIDAYRRHFRTRDPLPDHVAFVKDRPWE